MSSDGSTTIDTASAGPGPRAWGQLLLAELRSVMRDTSGLVVPLGLPVLIMVMFGLQAADEVIPSLDGLTAFDVYVVPLCLTIVVATIGVINLPSFLAIYRKGGVLKRLSATPVHPAMVLVAQVLTSVIQTLVGIGIAIGVAVLAFDLNAPRRLGVVIGVFALTALAMYAVGMLLGAVSPTPNAAVALGMVAFFAFGAAGGLFGPVENLPDWLARVGEVTPFGAGVEALRYAWAGETLAADHLLALGGWAVGSSLGAALLFRWE